MDIKPGTDKITHDNITTSNRAEGEWWYFIRPPEGNKPPYDVPGWCPGSTVLVFTDTGWVVERSQWLTDTEPATDMQVPWDVSTAIPWDVSTEPTRDDSTD